MHRMATNIVYLVPACAHRSHKLLRHKFNIHIQDKGCKPRHTHKKNSQYNLIDFDNIICICGSKSRNYRNIHKQSLWGISSYESISSPLCLEESRSLISHKTPFDSCYIKAMQRGSVWLPDVYSFCMVNIKQKITPSCIKQDEGLV